MVDRIRIEQCNERVLLSQCELILIAIFHPFLCIYLEKLKEMYVLTIKDY